MLDGGNGGGHGRPVNVRILKTGVEKLNLKPQYIGGALIVVLVAAMVLTSFYAVPQDSVAVVQTFGAYSRTADPGLHLRAPLGIERVTKVPVERVIKEEFGFRTVSAGVKSEYSTSDFSAESLMLTGDLNMADVEFVVQYKIKDPYLYVFHVRNVEDTFRDVAEAVMTREVGDRSVTDVITEGRSQIGINVQQELQDMLDQYETGVDVVTVQLQDVNPPGPVKDSFNEVNEAEQEQDRMINEAWKAYNTAIPEAQGKAKRVIAESNGYATDRVNRALGDATRFDAVYLEYKQAPDVTRRRLYLETMGTVMPRIKSKVIVDDDIENLLPMMEIQGAAVSKKKGGGK